MQVVNTTMALAPSKQVPPREVPEYLIFMGPTIIFLWFLSLLHLPPRRHSYSSLFILLQTQLLKLLFFNIQLMIWLQSIDELLSGDPSYPRQMPRSLIEKLRRRVDISRLFKELGLLTTEMRSCHGADGDTQKF